MKNKLKISSILLGSLLFLSNLNAKECINSKNIDVKWTSYKTLAKVGVSGHFNKVYLKIKNKNSSTIKSFLMNATVDINLNNIDANSEIKTSNIKKYFVNNLKSNNITAQIVNVYKNSIDVLINLNGQKEIIPMRYIYKNNKIIAHGIIDGRDFNLINALAILNKNVIGHLNKGWLDIDIQFEIKTINKCK